MINTEYSYDAQDPCKASTQLIKGFVKWSSIYNHNCKAQDQPNKFTMRISKDFDKVEKKLKKKVGIC